MTEPTLRDCINYMKQQLKGMEKYPKSYEFNIPYYKKTIELLEERQGRPQGTWEEGYHFRGTERQLFCSECKQEAEYNETHNYYFKSPFCPWCGAKMKAGDSDA